MPNLRNASTTTSNIVFLSCNICVSYKDDAIQ